MTERLKDDLVALPKRTEALHGFSLIEFHAEAYGACGRGGESAVEVPLKRARGADAWDGFSDAREGVR